MRVSAANLNRPLARRNDPSCPPRFTRGQVDALAALSGVLSVGSFSVNYLPSAKIFGVHTYYDYGTSLAAGVPLYFVAPGDAGAISATQVGAIGGTIGLRYGKDRNSTFEPYWTAVDNISIHLGLYATYATYRDARVQGRSDAWNDGWRPWTADEMITAPVRPKNLARPIVFVPLIIGAAGATVVAASRQANHTGERAGPATRDALLDTALGLDAGVTEEAFFRGVFFEELKLSLGRWPASVVDSVAFAMWHVPGELGANSTAEIVRGAFLRSGFSLLAEEAYLEGGLPASIALHALWDCVLGVGDAIAGNNFFAASAGRPAARVSSSRDPALFPLVSGTF